MARKPSLGKKYTLLEKQVTKFLAEKSVSDLTDWVLIEELIFNVYMADQAKEDIQENGITVNVRRTGYPLYQTNQAVSTYNSAVKNIQSICTKLGMTVQERTKLKLESEEKDPLMDLVKKQKVEN